MRHPSNIEIGVATHTGRVRTANEDDFLIYAPQSEEELADRGWFLAIADGMGGTTGGAEASRTAVRAAVRPFLDGAGDGPEARIRQGFAAATREVYDMSRENPNLRDMGTTLTVVNLRRERFVLGHVGDTRCLLLRDGRLVQLSHDHAVREADNYLTRCIGAGQQEVEVDLTVHDLRAGDRLVLLTDGAWGVVPEHEITRAVLGMGAQDAAEHLVREANRAGGPDNSTVLVAHVRDVSGDGELIHVDLPTEEVKEPALLPQPHKGLVPSRWPWVLLGVGLVLLALGVAKSAYDLDLLAFWFR